jgi:hypothetical protein
MEGFPSVLWSQALREEIRTVYEIWQWAGGVTAPRRFMYFIPAQKAHAIDRQVEISWERGHPARI